MLSTIAVISKVFIACCTNVFLLEAISRESPGSANLITFSQFALVAFQGLLVNYFKGKPRVIPLTEYAKMVILFFFVSTGNNFALNYNISVPLHVIFKSGSLFANLFLGVILLKRRYSVTKYTSVFLITIGIILCTISSYNEPLHKSKKESEDFLFTWLIGLSIMTVSLFTSAFMGIYQEKLYSKYGKHPQEALFYCHLLPLPGFLLLWSDLSKQIVAFNRSPLMALDFLPFFGHITVPRLWIYLFLNALTQYICVSSVFSLTSEHTSLTVTLVVTLRKFFSLLLSVVYFKNLFTFYHWIGAFLVFFGTLLFIDIHKSVYQLLTGNSSKTKKS